MAAFTPPPGAEAPASPLEGRLEVVFGPAPDGMNVLRDDTPPLGRDPRSAWPAFVADVVEDGGRLIPRVVHVDAAAGEWDWSAGPGRIWAAGEGSVAVFPVALREINANCVHNGLLRLELASGGAVRSAKVQIGAETCVYYKFDAWAAGAAHFVAGPVDGRQALVARDRENRVAQLPVAPIAALPEAYPGVDLARLAKAAGDDQAVYGLVVDGVNYAAPCRMSFGEDPYCEGRTLPSYSLAKSLVGGLGLMRLERLQPGLAGRAVAELAPDCLAHEPWTDVRLLDLLDMATGRYRSAAFEADEDAAGTLPFFLSRTHAQKLAFACRRFPRREPAGRTWVYHTSDTYLLGTAMTGALRAGGKADLYDDVLRPIWRGLKLSPALDETRRTLDEARQPFTGWGLFLTRDDAARLGVFLSRANAAEQDRLFDPALIGEALQRPGQERGLAAGSTGLRYAHGFWARDVAPLVGCARPVWTPFLSGYGGISIVVFPNGVVFYAFGDENVFDWGPAAEVANQVKALCS
ncbi:hypothetical protein [Phenylobacterium sp.]|uniref:hypothetical protein n=1 Tax=Phenylobacterium sp. TaxID=1871053 RepID=UPI0035B075BA